MILDNRILPCFYLLGCSVCVDIVVSGTSRAKVLQTITALDSLDDVSDATLRLGLPLGQGM